MPAFSQQSLIFLNNSPVIGQKSPKLHLHSNILLQLHSTILLNPTFHQRRMSTWGARDRKAIACRSVLQCVEVCCSVSARNMKADFDRALSLPQTSRANPVQCYKTHQEKWGIGRLISDCNTLQHTQHTATHRNTPRRIGRLLSIQPYIPQKKPYILPIEPYIWPKENVYPRCEWV